MGSSFSSVEVEAGMDDVVGREYGFRVHRVEANSPGSAAGLQSIIDYIVVANGVRLDRDDGTFVRMIAESKNTPMRLCVFDTHTLRTRETILTPNENWGGKGLIGITIRFDMAQELSKHTLHVLNVFPNSPASAAGLDAYNDYILGVGDLLYDGPDEFFEIVIHNERRSVRLYVYSVRTESLREVLITPDRAWGGEGCLGCGVGAGYLHSLPPRRDLRDGPMTAQHQTIDQQQTKEHEQAPANSDTAPAVTSTAPVSPGAAGDAVGIASEPGPEGVANAAQTDAPAAAPTDMDKQSETVEGMQPQS